MANFMTVAAVGDALDVSGALVLREIHRGHIPFLKIGGTYRIPADYVTSQLASAGVPTTTGGAD